MGTVKLAPEYLAISHTATSSMVAAPPALPQSKLEAVKRLTPKLAELPADAFGASVVFSPMRTREGIITSII